MSSLVASWPAENVGDPMVYWYVTVGVLLLYILVSWMVDLNYFLRLGITFVNARFVRKRTHVMDIVKTTGICLTPDVDHLLTHMNNARFLRELDFARADFYQRTGLFQAIQSKGGLVVQGASTIRYRKFIRVFSLYQIQSKILYWDNSCIYMEHRFVSPGDDFVRAIALCKQRILNASVEEILSELARGEKCPGGPENSLSKPEVPLELLRWIEFNEISSSKLRNSAS